MPTDSADENYELQNIANEGYKAPLNLSDLVWAACIVGLLSVSLCYKPADKSPATKPPTEELKPAPMPTPEEQDELYRKGLITGHNKERTKAGLSPLVSSPALNRVAISQAKWMAANKKLTHTQPAGLNARIAKEKYAYRTAGENIAYGHRSVSSVITGWLNSPGHRANILNKQYIDVGFGVALDSKGVPYWCAVFASPKFGSKAANADSENTTYDFVPPTVFADVNEINSAEGISLE